MSMPDAVALYHKAMGWLQSLGGASSEGPPVTSDEPVKPAGSAGADEAVVRKLLLESGYSIDEQPPLQSNPAVRLHASTPSEAAPLKVESASTAAGPLTTGSEAEKALYVKICDGLAAEIASGASSLQEALKYLDTAVPDTKTVTYNGDQKHTIGNIRNGVRWRLQAKAKEDFKGTWKEEIEKTFAKGPVDLPDPESFRVTFVYLKRTGRSEPAERLKAVWMKIKGAADDKKLTLEELGKIAGGDILARKVTLEGIREAAGIISQFKDKVEPWLKGVETGRHKVGSVASLVNGEGFDLPKLGGKKGFQDIQGALKAMGRELLAKRFEGLLKEVGPIMGASSKLTKSTLEEIVRKRLEKGRYMVNAESIEKMSESVLGDIAFVANLIEWWNKAS